MTPLFHAVHGTGDSWILWVHPGLHAAMIGAGSFVAAGASALFLQKKHKQPQATEPRVVIEGIDMNLFLAILAAASAVAPTVVKGIAVIHGNAVAGATKMQLAEQSLSLATATAMGLPNQLLGGALNQQIAAVLGSLGTQILQAGYNTAKADGTLAPAESQSLNLPAGATVASLTQKVSAPAATLQPEQAAH